MADDRLLRRLRASLSDTMTFAGRRVSMPPSDGDLASCLRSPALSLHARGVCPGLFDRHAPPSPVTLSDAFSGLLFERRRVVSPKAPRPTAQAVESELHRARALLLTDWDNSLVDGAAEAESQGFLDAANLPPWDTWLDLVTLQQPYGSKVCLLSWVPVWAADLVDRGVWVVPEACLTWAEVREGKVTPRVWGETWKAALRRLVLQRGARLEKKIFEPLSLGSRGARWSAETNLET